MTRQPSDSRHCRCSVVSTPSATAVMANPCASSMMVLTMATELAEAGSSRTKL